MAISYSALAAELSADPAALGYAGQSDPACAALLNAPRAGVTVPVGVVPAYSVFEAMDPTEWAALSAQEKQRIQTILSMGQVNTAGANTRAAFQAAFAAGTTSRANLVALLTRPGSRAEALFGAGTVVSDQDVGRARVRGS